MPRVSEQHFDDRRRAIITAARTQFARRGFDQTSMADLVEATGVSMGTLYRYFPSKTDLVLAVVEGRDGPVAGEYDTAETADQLLIRLSDYLNAATVDDATEHAKLVSHIWSSAAIDPEVARAAQQRHMALRAHLTQKIGGNDSQAAPAAEVALAALIGYAALVASNYPVNHDEFVIAIKAFVEPSN